MNEQAIQDMITNALSELEQVSEFGSKQDVANCEAYLDDLYTEQQSLQAA